LAARPGAAVSHQRGLLAAAKGKIPVYVKDTASEVIGIEDAATALLLAAEKGRIGERYIVSERFITASELYGAAAAAGGVWRRHASAFRSL